MNAIYGGGGNSAYWAANGLSRPYSAKNRPLGILTDANAAIHVIVVEYSRFLSNNDSGVR